MTTLLIAGIACILLLCPSLGRVTSFYAGDLVYITTLQPPNNANAKKRRLIALFEHSFGHVTQRYWNKKRNQFECVVQHIDDESKRLRIKEEYLRLIPVIWIHAGDANCDETLIRFNYLERIALAPDQWCFHVEQFGSKLFMDYEMMPEEIKNNWTRPLITEFYWLYELLSQFLLGARSWEGFTLLIQAMPVSMVERVFDAANERLMTVTEHDFSHEFDKMKRMHAQGQDEFMSYGYTQLIAPVSDEEGLRLLILDELVRQVVIEMVEFKQRMKKDHNTADLHQLFCLDVFKSYMQKDNDCQRGTFNVIMLDTMDPQKTKKSIIQLLLEKPEYQESAALMEAMVRIKEDRIRRVVYVYVDRANDRVDAIGILNSVSTLLVLIIWFRHLLKQGPLSFHFFILTLLALYYCFILAWDYGFWSLPDKFDEKFAIAASNHKILEMILRFWNSWGVFKCVDLYYFILFVIFLFELFQHNYY